MKRPHCLASCLQIRSLRHDSTGIVYITAWRDNHVGNFYNKYLLLLECIHERASVWPPAQVKSKLCYDRRSVGQSILVSGTHLGLKTRLFFSLWQLRVCWCGAPSLTRGRVYLLQCAIYLHFTCYDMNVRIYNIYKAPVMTSSSVRVRVRVRVTLRLAVYRQSVRLGDKPLETHDQKFYFPTEHLRL
jgi:hypothetical protein